MSSAGGAPVIAARGLTKSYRGGDIVTPVLHGVDLQVQRGDYVALMGPSGSGKSTLMNLLGLLDRADAGCYALDGRDVVALSASQQAVARNRSIGFVFQSFNLLKRMSALENVTLPLLYAGVPRRQAGQRAKTMLDRVGLQGLGQRMPSQLSGGQQQRVAIARALVNDPPLLLADEPTGNLDTRTAHEVLDVLAALNAEQGLSIVIVTHESDVAARGKRLVRLKDGLIVYDGAPQAEAAA